MKKWILCVAMLCALGLEALEPQTADYEMLERVYLDAQVIKRVAEVAHRDLPRDLLLRIVAQDVEILRGKQMDGTYAHAHFEPIEAGRVAEGFTVKPQSEGDRLDRNQFRAKNVYKLIVDIPSRRFLVARNSDIFLDRIEVSYENQKGDPKNEIFDVGRTIEAGEKIEFELAEVASDAIATVYARSENNNANMELIFVKADLVDNADSPYFGVVQSAKLLEEAIQRRDQTAMQSLSSSMAGRIETFMGAFERAGSITGGRDGAVPPAETPERQDTRALLDLYLELERIEDLLTGSESERRDGMDELHQLIRQLRRSALEATER